MSEAVNRSINGREYITVFIAADRSNITLFSPNPQAPRYMPLTLLPISTNATMYDLFQGLYTVFFGRNVLSSLYERLSLLPFIGIGLGISCKRS